MTGNIAPRNSWKQAMTNTIAPRKWTWPTLAYQQYNIYIYICMYRQAAGAEIGSTRNIPAAARAIERQVEAMLEKLPPTW